MNSRQLRLQALFVWTLFACGGHSDGSSFQDSDGGSESNSGSGKLTDGSYVLGDCEHHDGGVDWLCPSGYGCYDLEAFGVVGKVCGNNSCPVCAKAHITDVLVCDARDRHPTVQFKSPPVIICVR